MDTLGKIALTLLIAAVALVALLFLMFFVGGKPEKDTPRDRFMGVLLGLTIYAVIVTFVLGLIEAVRSVW
jgi:fatty acid desaturase